MQPIKTQADVFAMTNAPFNDKEIFFHILNDLGSNYNEILATIHARNGPISFEKNL